MSGTLQNFAGGVMLLIFKPFKVGDLIESQGYTGTVKEIQIFVTILLTPENKNVFLPNGAVANGEITNYATEGTIRVDLDFGIGYGESIETAKKVLYEILNKHDKVLHKPPPFVGVNSLGDSAVNLAVRPYASPEDYWRSILIFMKKVKTHSIRPGSKFRSHNESCISNKAYLRWKNSTANRIVSFSELKPNTSPPNTLSNRWW